VKLEHIIVSSYQMGGVTDEGERPEDQFRLNFGKIDFLYSVQRTGELVETEFDFVANKSG